MVDHDYFGHQAEPTRGIGRTFVAFALRQGSMGGIECITVEIAAVGPAGRVIWRDIAAWRRVWASLTMVKVPQTVTSEVWGFVLAHMDYPEGPREVCYGLTWSLMHMEPLIRVNVAFLGAW